MAYTLTKELTDTKRNEIAIEVADFWKNNCTDDEFYNNCRDSVDEILHNYDFTSEERTREYHIVLDLINNVYCYDNWEVMKFIHDNKGFYLVQGGYVIVNDVTISNVWEVYTDSDTLLISDIDGTIADIDIDKVKSFKIILDDEY